MEKKNIWHAVADLCVAFAGVHVVFRWALFALTVYLLICGIRYQVAC